MPHWVLRGRWLVGHVVVVLLAALFVRLGVWQLDRLDQRREENALIRARMRAAPVAVGALPRDPEDARYRTATATGTYDASRQVTVRYRSLDGQPGAWVLTPLRLDLGRAVVVNRGWVPDGATAADYRPPPGQVRVAGMAQTSQTRGSLGPADPPTGTLANLSRVDVARLQQQVPYELAPVWLQLRSQDPPQPGRLPVTLPEPDLGEGPHLSYALQWFGFTLVGLVGWPLLVRREWQRRRGRRP